MLKYLKYRTAKGKCFKLQKWNTLQLSNTLAFAESSQIIHSNRYALMKTLKIVYRTLLISKLTLKQKSDPQISYTERWHLLKISIVMHAKMHNTQEVLVMMVQSHNVLYWINIYHSNKIKLESNSQSFGGSDIDTAWLYAMNTPDIVLIWCIKPICQCI